MLYNCNLTSLVDFGYGLVKIRCTKTGEHVNHTCHVVIFDPNTKEEPESTVEHRNIFKTPPN